MAEEVSRIEVYAGLEDRDLIAGLRRAEAEVERTAAKIRSEKAEATIGADLTELKKDIKEAEARLKAFKKQRADAGSLSAAEKGALTKRIQAEEAILDAKNAQLATSKKNLAAAKNETAEQQRQARMAAAEQKLEQTRSRLQEQQARRKEQARKREQSDIEKRERTEARAFEADKRRRAARERDEARMAATSERESIRRRKSEIAFQARMDRIAAKSAKDAKRATYDRTVGIAKEQARVIELQRQYAKLTDTIEKLSKERRFSTEGRAKLDLDVSGARAKMAAIKAELNFFGAHPPVEIQVEIDRRRSMNVVRRQFAVMGDIIRNIAEKAANLKDVTLRVGPFTGTIKTFTVALGFLGPTLIDVLGSLSSLVGVIGGGLTGAMAVGSAALTGFGFGITGLMMASKTAREEMKVASQATDAYSKAVLKYGKGSKEAKKAQEQMNSVLKTVSPLAREAAKGQSEFLAGFESATGPARKSMTSIVKGFYGAMKAITPMWAESTNALADTLDTNLKGGFKFLKSPEFANNFKQITSNFNTFMGPLMQGFGSLGRAFLNFGREGSKFLPELGNSFKSFGDRVLAFTQKDSFGSTVKRWVGYARDLGHFFGAATRVMVHFFGAGAEAGDGLLITMTKALNRWDDFLTSSAGREDFANGFERAADGARALWGAIAPIAGAFVTWSSNLSPFVTGLLTGLGAVTKLATKVAELVNMTGWIGALGTSLGALWAVGRIGAFIAMLAKVPALLRAIYAAQGAGAVAKTVLTGGLFGAGRKAAMKQVAGEADDVAKRVAKVSGAAIVAEGAVGGLGGALAGMTVAGAAATGGLALLAGGVGVLGYKLITAKSDAEKFAEGLSEAEKATRAYKGTSQTLNAVSFKAGQSMREYKDSIQDVIRIKKELSKLESQGKESTSEYRNKVDELTAALGRREAGEKRTKDLFQLSSKLQREHTQQMQKARQAQDSLNDAKKREAEAQRRLDSGSVVDVGYQENARRAKALADAKRDVASASKAVAAQQAAERDSAFRSMMANINYERALKRFPAIAGAAAKALQGLSKTPNVQKKIALKYQDPKDAARVAKSARSAIQAGVGSPIVSKIVGDSKSAEDAVKRINRIRLVAKTLRINNVGGAEAQRVLNYIEKKKLTAKVAKILASDSSARSKIQQLEALGINPKIARILGDNTDAKRKVAEANRQTIRELKQAIRRFIGNPLFTGPPPPPVTQMVKRKLGGNPTTAASGKSAGWSAGPNEDRKIARAARTADLSGPRVTRGGKYNQPTMLVGEENRSEFVIATNPKYRKQNKRYLKQAASWLGMKVNDPMEAAKAGKVSALGKSPFGSFGSDNKGPEFNPKEKVNRKRKFTPAKKRKGKLASNRGWASYIEGLQTQQGYWEREVSIRESQVKEPADLVVRDPANDKVVNDPVTGESTTVEAFKANPDIAPYKDQMKLVLDAMTTLMSIIAELVRAIPHAIAANRQEQGMRSGSVKFWDKEIEKDKSGLRKAKKDDKPKWQKRLDKAKDKRDKEVEILKTLKGDEKTLGSARVDAGFSYREADIAFKSLKAEYDAVDTKATSEAAAQSKPSGTSGTGSTGPSTPSTDQAQIDQTAAALTASLANGVALSSALAAFTSSGDIGSGGYGSAYAASMSSNRAATFMTSSGSGSYGGGSSYYGGSAPADRSASPSFGGGSGTWAGGGSTPVININTLHPGDSRTLDAIGRAATAGQSQQGYVTAPRASIGL